jgi:hypothetical protein
VSITGAIGFYQSPPATGGPSCHPITGFCRKVLDVSKIHSFYVNINDHATILSM